MTLLTQYVEHFKVFHVSVSVPAKRVAAVRLSSDTFDYVEHFKVFHVSLLTFVGSILSSDTFDNVEHVKVFHVSVRLGAGQTCFSSASSFSSAESTHSAAHLFCVRGGLVVFSCGEEGGGIAWRCSCWTHALLYMPSSTSGLISRVSAKMLVAASHPTPGMDMCSWRLKALPPVPCDL